MIGPISGSSGTGTQQSSVGGLSSQNFLDLMIAQLKYQDPFKPMDAASMMQQTSSLTSVQTLQDVSALQKEILGMQEAATATGLLGKQVSATDASGNVNSGVVSAVSYTAQGPMLKVAGVDVPIANVTEATTAPGNGTRA
jgi:flagellar basal-body rod modification protein FlgD